MWHPVDILVFCSETKYLNFIRSIIHNYFYLPNLSSKINTNVEFQQKKIFWIIVNTLCRI